MGVGKSIQRRYLSIQTHCTGATHRKILPRKEKYNAKLFILCVSKTAHKKIYVLCFTNGIIAHICCLVHFTDLLQQ